MNEKSLHILEFDKILDRLAACCQTEGGRAMAHELSVLTDRSDIIRRQTLTSEALTLANGYGRPSVGGIHDVTSAASRASKGALLSMRDLLRCAAVLRAARLARDHAGLPDSGELSGIFARLVPNRYLEDRISGAILSEDTMADNASPALAEIRRTIKRTNLKIRDMLQKYVSGDARYLQENIITTRGGRFVIPVKSEYRGEVKGLIHDTSQSGSTLFVEPMGVVEANNELRELEARESHEIERILYEFSAEVGECASAITGDYENLILLDLIFAAAELSHKMKGVSPTITDERRVELRRARHPLLDPATVVPITVEIGGDYKMLVITGPNTGGKTVTLKTAGLLAAMAQAGLHIPVDDGSTVCVFDDIFAEIGDEQSIEQSLSTFSSHMKGIVGVLGNMSENSLILFDELGSGTDPVEGAALATAILEEVRQCGALCVATTHYAELKAYAIETDSVMNASCEFDIATLRPTYRLIIGTPGKSNAFAISEKLGLPEHIVRRADRLIGNDSKSFESVIEKLETTRHRLEVERESAAQMRRELEAELAAAKRESEAALEKAKAESERMLEKSRSMLDGARATCEYVFRELDEAKRRQDQSDLSETKRELRRKIREYDDRVDPVLPTEDDGYVLPRELHAGDNVIHRNIGVAGVLIGDPDKNGNVFVRMGGAKTRANVKDLRLIEDGAADKKKKKDDKSSYRAAVSRNFKPECDIRGMTGDDGCFMVDKFLDEANVAGIKSVTVIHGKGTGALRAAVWKFLKSDRRVKGFRAGQYGEGDYGVTVIELK